VRAALFLPSDVLVLVVLDLVTGLQDVIRIAHYSTPMPPFSFCLFALLKSRFAASAPKAQQDTCALVTEPDVCLPGVRPHKVGSKSSELVNREKVTQFLLV